MPLRNARDDFPVAGIFRCWIAATPVTCRLDNALPRLIQIDTSPPIRTRCSSSSNVGRHKKGGEVLLFPGLSFQPDEQTYRRHLWVSTVVIGAPPAPCLRLITHGFIFLAHSLRPCASASYEAPRYVRARVVSLFVSCVDADASRTWHAYVSNGRLGVDILTRRSPCEALCCLRRERRRRVEGPEVAARTQSDDRVRLPRKRIGNDDTMNTNTPSVRRPYATEHSGRTSPPRKRNGAGYTRSRAPSGSPRNRWATSRSLASTKKGDA